jgi:hypothetical protein
MIRSKTYLNQFRGDFSTKNLIENFDFRIKSTNVVESFISLSNCPPYFGAWQQLLWILSNIEWL